MFISSKRTGSVASSRSKPRWPNGLGEGWFGGSDDALEGPVLGDVRSSDRNVSGEGEDSDDRNPEVADLVDTARESRTMDPEPRWPNGSGEGWS